ncbi:tyrosine-type recombinase/integrase [Mesorhizobium sp. M0814]
MSRLRTALERYVGMRQGLGYKYHGPARRLSDFVTFMEARGAETITTALAMKWVTLIGRQPSWSIRLTDVRCFAQHLAHFDPMTEVPPQDAVPPARRAKPYIYTDAEITALLAAALALPPANGLRRWTYHCLFGLIAVAGLRHSEALDLRRDDVDLDQGVLTIRETKFGKSRLVPLHATTVAVLSDYAARRDAHLVAPRSPYFFVAEQGGRLLHQYVHRVFWQLSRQIGLRQRGQRNGRGFTIFVTVSPSRP